MSVITRSISQQEIAEYQKFREANFIVNSEHNASRLCEPILTVGQQIDQSTLRASFAMVQGQLSFESAAQREYNEIAAIFTQAQLDQFESWLAHQRLVSDESDQGLSNRALILEQLRGRDFNDLTMAQALSRVANNAKRPLFVKPEPPPESFGRHSNKVFADQGSVTLSVDEKTTWDDHAKFATNGRVNHAHSAKAQPVKASIPSQEYHQRRALAVRGGTHAENQVLSKIFITSLGLRMSVYSNEVDWFATATAREAELKQMVRAKERGR
jgi:hypothetical protein